MVKQIDSAYQRQRSEFKKVIRKFDFRAFQVLTPIGISREIAWAAAKEYRVPPPPEKFFLPEFAYWAETTSATHKRTQASAVTESASPRRDTGLSNYGKQSSKIREIRNENRVESMTNVLKVLGTFSRWGEVSSVRVCLLKKPLKVLKTRKKSYLFRVSETWPFSNILHRTLKNWSWNEKEKQWDRFALLFKLPRPKEIPKKTLRLVSNALRKSPIRLNSIYISDHDEESKWRLSSLPWFPKTESCFEGGCLLITVYVGHPEIAESLEIYFDNRLEFRVQLYSSKWSVSGIHRVYHAGQRIILICQESFWPYVRACHLLEANWLCDTPGT